MKNYIEHIWTGLKLNSTPVTGLSFLFILTMLTSVTAAHASHSPHKNCICDLFNMESEDLVACKFEEECLPVKERIANWDIGIYTNTNLGFLTIKIDGGDDPSGLRVKIVDPNGQVFIDPGEMGGRKLTIGAEPITHGNYIAHFILRDEVIMRHMFILQPY